MLHRAGRAGDLRRALDLYFERHDGQACTIEDWLDGLRGRVGPRPLAVQALVRAGGHAAVERAETWAAGRYGLELAQATPPTPGQPEKAPLAIPVAYGLLDADGATMAEGVLELTEARRSFEWELPGRPVPSLLRGFSAPVILDRDAAPAERAFLLAHDDDPFNKWEAGTAQALATLTRLAGEPDATADPSHLAAIAAVADDAGLDPAFKALALGLPSEEDVIAHIAGPGPGARSAGDLPARRALTAAIAAALGDRLGVLYAGNAVRGPLQPRRRSRRAAGAAGAGAGVDDRARSARQAARAQFEAADNMTERMGALGLLVAHGQGDEALARLPRGLGRRPPGDRQVVRGAGRADPAGRRRSRPSSG